MSNIVILRIYEKKEYLVLHGMGFYSYLAIFYLMELFFIQCFVNTKYPDKIFP